MRTHSKRRRTAAVLSVSAASLMLATSPASAVDWQLSDTDNISRSTSNGRAFTTHGAFRWYKTGWNYNDYKASFAAKLNIRGPAGSCALMRVTIYDSQGKTRTFPAAGGTRFGYKTVCAWDGSGTETYSGTDVNTATLFDAPKHTKAVIKVCYAVNKWRPPTQCNTFTVNRGD